MSITQASTTRASDGRRESVAAIRASLLPLLLCLALGSTVAMAADLRRITLSDGSVINGEVLEMKDDVYIIRSATLGTVRLSSAQVRGIDTMEAIPAPAAITGTSGVRKARGEAVEGIAERLGNDPSTMELITKLQEDPKIQDILNDPEIMNAVQSGDPAALEDNPKIRDLMNHPAVEEINKKMVQ